jgi:malate dehydrogenase
VATIAILGAGEIGGALARQVASLDLVSRIIIVDDLANVAAGKALDVAQSGPVDGYHTALSGTSDIAAVVGAAAIVIADRASSSGPPDPRTPGPSPFEWHGEDGLALVTRAAGLNGIAPIVCAGASQHTLIEKGVSEGGVSRLRLFGSAPEALRSAIVSITALEAGAAPADISLSVLGRAPQNVIVPWDEGAIAGRPATGVLSAAQLARLDARVSRLWPPGPYALAGAATAMLRSALTRSPRVHAALVATTRDEGAMGRSAMMPVTLRPSGIAQLVTPILSARDRVRVDTALRGEPFSRAAESHRRGAHEGH